MSTEGVVVHILLDFAEYVCSALKGVVPIPLTGVLDLNLLGLFLSGLFENMVLKTYRHEP